MVDKNEFFREVTLRLCSHLNIEEGLQACIEYLSQHIPADTLYLEKNEPELGAMRIIARADASSCKLMDLLIPYNEQAQGQTTRRLVGTRPAGGRRPLSPGPRAYAADRGQDPKPPAGPGPARRLPEPDLERQL